MIKNYCALLVCVFIICSNKLQAQVPAWAGGADYHNFSFGFHFQYISNDFKILRKTDWRNPYIDNSSGNAVTDSLNSISSNPSQGFAVGFLARLRITDNLELRTTPSLVFTDRALSYQYRTPLQNVDKQVHASMIELPLDLKIKSDRLGNFRAYILGGVKYSYGINAPKKNDDANLSPLDKMVNNKRSYASYEVGLGCDIYFDYFKFSPEIKVSNAFKDVLIAEDNPYSRPIDKLFLHTVVFTIYFE